MNIHNPVQSDLFDAAFSNAPEKPKAKQSAPSSSAPTLLGYTTKIALRIWHTNHTRKHNLRDVQWFAAYKDFGQLSIADIRKGHIYDFIYYSVAKRGVSRNKGNWSMASLYFAMTGVNHRVSIHIWRHISELLNWMP